MKTPNIHKGTVVFFLGKHGFVVIYKDINVCVLALDLTRSSPKWPQVCSGVPQRLFLVAK